MMKLPKATENCVKFAQWCVINRLTESIRQVGELRTLVDQRVKTWERQNHQEMDYDAAEMERLDEKIEKLAAEMGITDMNWPGLYPTFITPARFNDSMLPEVDSTMDARQLAKAQQAEYDSIVAGAARDLLVNLDVDDDQDLDEQMIHAIDDMENSHPWVLDDDKAIIVLRYSNNPTAEFFRYGSPLKSNECNYGKANFPFSTCAAAAFAEDVKDYLQQHHGLEHGFDGSLNAESVLLAQAKLELYFR